MKKQILSIGFTALSALTIVAQPITTTVSLGAGYTDQKWYSLEHGEKGTQSKDNWDLAFEITGFSSAILANTQKANFALYKAPFAIADYSTLDTVGISAWPFLYNSDTTWEVGAFNRGANPNNDNDLGWGVYDMNTHFVNGDSCYVVKLSASSYKKLKIVKLASGAYTFEYADINGANSYTQSIVKSTYNGKNFVYFDLTSNTIIDREPLSAEWDLTFGRYTAFVMAPNPTPYPVVGVMSNKGVKVAQVNNVTDPATFSEWSSQNFTSNITEIGHDWKNVDMVTSLWNIVNDSIYFIQDKQGNIWKLRFISFGGSANGDFVFSKEKFSSVGITNNTGKSVSSVGVYPNPGNGEAIHLVITSDEPVSGLRAEIIDMNGRVVHSEPLDVEQGFYTRKLNTPALTSGVYFLTIQNETFTNVQKLIITN